MSGSKERAVAPEGIGAFRVGCAVAVAASILTVWTTIVRDDGNGAGSLMVVMAAAASAFAVELKAAGMARAMLGVAVLNAAMGGLLATDPSTPYVERTVLWTLVLGVMWLASAGLFRLAARSRTSTAPHP